VSADHDIAEWLGAHGYGLPEVRAAARAVLEEARLTRPGKLRFSAEKVPRAEAALRQKLVLHCEAQECQAWARATGRTPLPCSSRSHCERCGGSSNQRAEKTLLEACRRHGVRKLVVVGGSPAVREELARALGEALLLRMVDGTERRTADKAKSDLEWGDLVLVWGATELHHKVSWLYTQPPAHRHKVVHVVRRGVAALLEAAVEHFERRG
jgi:hypothetical protein